MDYSKKKALDNLISAHKRFRDVLSQVKTMDTFTEKLIEEWSVRDVVAHLIGWNIEYLEEIKRVLNDQVTWNKLYDTTEGDDRFNKGTLEKLKALSWDEVVKEWDTSFQKLIKRIEKLTDREWNYAAKGELWTSPPEMKDTPVTVKSLFVFEIEGNAHELEHAKEVEGVLRKKGLLKI
jgi:hypothetical protein